MALPPSPISGDAGAIPPPGAAPADDMAMADEGGEEVVATICRLPDGTFRLYRGDEPEEGAEMAAGEDGAAAEGETFDSGPSLMRALMPILEGGNEAKAEAGFGEGFKGNSEDMAGAGPAMAG